MLRKLAVVATAAVAALAFTAVPASATSLQTTDGVAYVGELNGTLAAPFTIADPDGTLICNQSTLSGQVTSAGAGAADAAGRITSDEFSSHGNSLCPQTAGNDAVLSAGTSEADPWLVGVAWIDDNEAGTPNASVSIPEAFLFATLSGAGTCSYLPGPADFSDTTVHADFFNPDNTTSGYAELRLVNEPYFSDCETPAAVSGTYRLTGAGDANLQVRETVGATANPPVCEDINATTEFDTPVSIALDCSGALPITHSIVDGPDNGTISGDPSDGTLTYTPTAGYSGTDTFTYKANNEGGDSSTAAVSVQVKPLPPAPICQDVGDSTDYETALTVTLDCAGEGPLAYGIVDGPDNGTISGDPSDGTLTYTPGQGFVGTDTFTYTATNRGGTSNTATVTIDVDPVAPTCEDISTFAPHETAVTIPLDCDSSGSLEYALTSTPAHGDITAGPEGGSVTYEPDDDYSGPDTLQYTATNSEGTSAPATISINVRGEAPVCQDVATSTQHPNSVTVPLDCAGADSLSYEIVAGPPLGSASLGPGDGNATYTPWASGNGDETFTYRAYNNGTASNVATVSVHVIPRPPTCSDMAISADYFTAKSFNLNCSGSGDWSRSIVSGPEHGTITTGPAAGGFTYTPARHFSGTDTFTYKATGEGGDSGTSTATIVVGGPLPPTCSSLAPTTSYGMAVEISLSCTSQSPLGYAIASAPSHGTISGDPSDGTLAYTPDAGFSGTDDFTYTATNDGGDSAPATVTVTVGAPTPPSGDSAGQTGATTSKPGKKCKKPKRQKSAAAAKKKGCKKKRK